LANYHLWDLLQSILQYHLWNWCTDDMHRNCKCSEFLSLLWEWKHRQTLTAEFRKILFVENLVGEKRRERLHIGEYRGAQKLVIPWARVGSGFYNLFLHCLRVEMPFSCKQVFPREKCLLDLLQCFLQVPSPSDHSKCC
jgi:hypothetical protein